MGRTAAVSLLVVAFVGCGSTHKSATKSAPLPPGVTTFPKLPPVKSVTYGVDLSSATTTAVTGVARAPAGARNASGRAVISVNASSNELCWTFSQLKNVGAPTVARIYRAAAPGSWRYGYPLGHPYKASGCIPENSVFLGLLGAKPQEFYVSIHTARFPGGAVRGQI